jgi:hypothetical protein
MEVLDPSACKRKSVALCLFFPVVIGLLADSRRCDSASSRCNAKSFFKFADSEASSSSTIIPDLLWTMDMAGVLLGGFEL